MDVSQLAIHLRLTNPILSVGTEGHRPYYCKQSWFITLITSIYSPLTSVPNIPSDSFTPVPLVTQFFQLSSLITFFLQCPCYIFLIRVVTVTRHDVFTLVLALSSSLPQLPQYPGQVCGAA